MIAQVASSIVEQLARGALIQRAVALAVMMVDRCGGASTSLFTSWQHTSSVASRVSVSECLTVVPAREVAYTRSRLRCTGYQHIWQNIGYAKCTSLLIFINRYFLHHRSKKDAMAVDDGVRVYKRRWIMLALFVLCAANITVHWMQFSIIANIVMKYYDVSSHAVNWTSMVFMAAYVLLVVPASWLVEKKGLKVTLTSAAVLMTAGSWIKVLSASRRLFPVAFLGQTLLGAAQIFVLGVPASVAAAWFGPDQVSTATAVGVFGLQFGAAIGFIIPPMVVGNHDNVEDIGTDLLKLYLGLAAGPTIVLILIVLVFQAAPPLPPSAAQASIQRQVKERPYSETLKSLLTNRNFLFLLVSYGANMGTFNTNSTLLNQILLTYFQGSEADGGRIGLVMILSGMIGSVVGGFVLDKTHKFKETSLVVCAMALLGMISYTVSFGTGYIVIVYITVAFLGFFLTSYMTVAFEFAAELTYPLAAGTSSGLLNMAAEVWGVALTMAAGALLAAYGDLAANAFLCALLLSGLGAAALVRGGDLRRQAAGRPSLEEPLPPTGLKDDAQRPFLVGFKS